VRLVRDSGRVLNGVPQFVGRHGGRPTSAACGSAESPDFRPARFCGGSRADLLFARQFCAFPLAGATREKERERERTVVLGSYGVVFSLFARAILLCSHPSSTCSQLLLITGKKEKDLLLLSL
jgi:hypothetical protein